MSPRVVLFTLFSLAVEDNLLDVGLRQELLPFLVDLGILVKLTVRVVTNNLKFSLVVLRPLFTGNRLLIVLNIDSSRSILLLLIL